MTESTLACDRCSAPVPAGASTCPSCGAPMSEAAATGFETTKIGDVFATTKLEMPPEEPVQEAFVEEPATPEPAPEPKPVRPEPTFIAPPPVEPAYTPSTRAESVKPTKEWYQNPLVWAVGCLVLFLCCSCTGIVVVVSFLAQRG